MTFIPSYAQIDSPDPVNPQDLATKNYIDTKPFFSVAGPAAPGSVASGATAQLTTWNGASVQRGAGSFVTATGVYTVGLAGIYRVRLQVYWALATAFSTNAGFHTFIQRNGVEVCRASMYIVTLTGGVNLVSPLADRSILCSVGDTFTFFVQNSSSVAESLAANSANSNLEVIYIQP